VREELHLHTLLTSALDRLSGIPYPGRLTTEEVHFRSFELKVCVFWKRDKFLHVIGIRNHDASDVQAILTGFLEKLR
jgi:hypothetical protein